MASEYSNSVDFVNDEKKWGKYTSGLTADEVVESVTKGNDISPLKYGASHMMGNWVYEPHRQNHFELQIIGMEGIRLLDKAYHDDSSYITGSYSAAYLTLSLNNFTMPDLKVSKIPVSYGNSKVFYAGTPEYGDMSISFNDFVGLNVESILCAWFRQVYDPITEKINYSNYYKKEAYLMEYNVDGSFGGCWKIEGLWINTFKPGQYGQENGTAVRKLDCTFSYDRIYPYKLLRNNADFVGKSTAQTV